MSTTVSSRSAGSLNPTRQQLDELETLLKRMLDLPVNQLGVPDESEEADDEPVAPPQGKIQPAEPEPIAPAVSYMVVETASPRPLPPASGFEPRPSVLTPRLVPAVTPRQIPVEEMAAPPAPVVSPAQLPAPDSPSPETEVWVPLRSTWQPSAQTWQPLAESWQQANGAAPTPAAMPAPIPSAKADLAPPAPVESIPRVTTQMIGQASHLSQAAKGETPIPTATAPAEQRLSLTAEDAPIAVSPMLLPLLWFNQGFDGCVAPLGGLGRWLCGPRARHTLGAVGLLSLLAAAVIAVSAGMGWTR